MGMAKRAVVRDHHWTKRSRSPVKHPSNSYVVSELTVGEPTTKDSGLKSALLTYNGHPIPITRDTDLCATRSLLHYGGQRQKETQPPPARDMGE